MDISYCRCGAVATEAQKKAPYVGDQLLSRWLPGAGADNRQATDHRKVE